MKVAIGAIAALVLFSALGVSQAQEFLADMNDASAWTVIKDDDASAEFGFDYSIYGIPKAPNSPGDDTLGIRAAANIADGAAAAVSMSPNGIVGRGRYLVSADVWLNYYADPDNSGTTEYAGMSVGFSDRGAPLNGGGLVGSTDGDASEDYLLVVDGTKLDFDTEQYLVESLNNIDVTYTDLFPSEETPDQQLDFDPPNEPVLTAPGSLAFAWREFKVDVDTEGGQAIFLIDDLEIGFIDIDLNALDIDGRVALNMWDRFSSVAPEEEFAFTIFDNLKVEILDGGVIPGDFDDNGSLEVDDLDALITAVRDGSNDNQFDLDANGDIDVQDVNFWVNDLKNTWLGDANLDGEFNSADFVAAFTEGQYEDGIAMNSTWGAGDWNADGDFDSADFVAAFTQGGYENGPRAATAAVPEPSSMLLLLLAGLPLGMLRR